MQKPSSVELVKNGSGLAARENSAEVALDPDDPMSCGWLRKHSILAYISLLGGLGTYAGLFIVPASKGVSRRSRIWSGYTCWCSVQDLGFGTHSHRLSAGDLYIVSTAVALGVAIWGACARSYGSMAGARVLLAFGLTAVHALGGITVAGMFPREVRGEKMGWWTLLTTLGPFLGPIFAAYIVQGTGNWHWIFGHPAIVLGVVLIYIVPFVPETLYFEGNIGEQHQARKLSIRLRPFEHAEIPKWSTAFFRPLIMLRYPTCWLPAFWFAWTSSWFVGIGTIITINFRCYYNLTAPNVNLVYIAPLLGAVLGELASRPFSDFVIERLTQQNNGYRRPEMRLHAMYPAIICIVVGLVVFGVTLQQQRHYIMSARVY
ncbi:major facilitator superfamily domain-containing protein [Diaporthe sp. PMI_573]|nr:major facilitator superfamily domain-containing protein [Diaporthaceae sp. PMI_573]